MKAIIALPAPAPRCSRAISAIDTAPWRTEAVRLEKSCTAPISTTPRAIHSRHGSPAKTGQARSGAGDPAKDREGEDRAGERPCRGDRRKMLGEEVERPGRHIVHAVLESPGRR